MSSDVIAGRNIKRFSAGLGMARQMGKSRESGTRPVGFRDATL
jgi:hypothetical protein